MADDEPGSLQDRRFAGRSLRGSRFVGCDLSGVVVRGSLVDGLEIDSPWLGEPGNRLLVNGIDVVPLVNAQLDRDFPGRALRTAETPAGLREAWTAVEHAWADTMAWAASLPGPVTDASVDGEWSLAQTLRHLVMATDIWLGQAVLRQEQPFHPLGLRNDDDGPAADDRTESPAGAPPFPDVVAARAGRQGLVRGFLAEVTSDQLRDTRPDPHDPAHEETVLSCLRTILEEEWEHHRYAVRDLTALAGDDATRGTGHRST